MIESTKRSSRLCARAAKLVGIGVVVAALVALARLLPVSAWLAAFQDHVRDYGAWGYVLFALVYAICTVLFVPGSILTLGAGALFGLWKGSLVVLVGASAGAIAAFLLARTVMRSRVAAVVSRYPKFEALDRAIGREGGKIVFLMRLAPVFPFNIINYAFGVTAVRPLAYTIATVIGMIPGTIAYVYLGQVGAEAATAASGDGGGGARLAIHLAGAAAAIGATFLVARVASRAIKSAGIE